MGAAAFWTIPMLSSCGYFSCNLINAPFVHAGGYGSAAVWICTHAQRTSGFLGCGTAATLFSEVPKVEEEFSDSLGLEAIERLFRLCPFSSFEGASVVLLRPARSPLDAGEGGTRPFVRLLAPTR